MTTVAILGTGRVARALGERLLHAGVNVCFGARDPEAAASALPEPLSRIPTRTPDEAAADAQIVLLAVPAVAAMHATRSAGSLDGKILLDCTNSLRRDGGGPTWAPPPEGSMAQALAVAFPGHGWSRASIISAPRSCAIRRCRPARRKRSSPQTTPTRRRR